MIEHAHQNPEDKPTVKGKLQDIRALHQPLYEADTAANEVTCKKLLKELKSETKTTTTPFALSDETGDQLRSALLPFFTKSAPDDADSEK